MTIITVMIIITTALVTDARRKGFTLSNLFIFRDNPTRIILVSPFSR